MLARLLCLICLFGFLLSGSYALYNDAGNDSCLIVYSDQQNYHTSVVQRGVSAELFFENKCGKELTVDFGLLAKDNDAFLFKSAQSFDGAKGSWKALSLPEKNVSPSTGAALVPKKGWGNLVVPISGARVKVSFDALVSQGEFFIYAQDTLDPHIVSLLDPWWSDGEIIVDQYTLALWDFNENAGTTVHDNNQGKHDLTLSNALAWDAVNKKWGASAFGADGAYTATNATLLDDPPDSNSLSIGGWIYPNVQIDNTILTSNRLAQKDNSTGNDQLILYFPPLDGRLRFIANSSTGPGDCSIYSDNAIWLADTWYWVEVTWNTVDGTKMYVNGVLQADVGPTCNKMMGHGTTTDFWLGDSGTGTHIFNGVMEEWEVASTDRDINPPAVTGVAGFAASVEKIDGFSANAGLPSFSYFLDGNLTIDFNLLNGDNNRLYVDINYNTVPSPGSGTVIVKDLNITSLLCLDGNNNWGAKAASCHWDWNISGVADTNYYIIVNAKNWNYKDSNVADVSNNSFEINNVPDLNVIFWDENHFALKLVNISAAFNGTTKAVDPTDGNLTFSLTGMAPGVYSLSAWQDNNYAVRYFDINYTGRSIVMNPRLLRDVNGSEISFKFYNEAGTSALSYPFITVYRGWGDWNIVGQRWADSAGQTSFFLHPDTNYVFQVKSGDSSVYYYPVSVSTQLPKNEVSLASISPFDLTVSGIGLQQFLGNAGAPVKLTFPNTVTMYIFDVNAGLSYYNRKYFLDFKGNPHTYSLQPYLVARADSIQSVFFVRNSTSAAGLPNIRIQSQKSIPTQGTITVEDVITDSAGEAALSFIVNDTYNLYFYRNGNLVYSAVLRPTSTSYQVYLDLETFEVGTGTLFTADCNFVPSGGMAFILADGMVDLNQTCFVTGTTLQSVTVIVTNDTNTIFNYHLDANTNSLLLQQGIVGAGLKNYSTLKVTVYVLTVDGNFVLNHSYSIQTGTSIGGQLFAALRDVLPSELGGTGLLLLSLLIIIIVTGAFASTITGDPSGLGIVACIVAGILTYIGWIPGIIFAAMTTSAVVIFIITRRWEYQ